MIKWMIKEFNTKKIKKPKNAPQGARGGLCDGGWWVVVVDLCVRM